MFISRNINGVTYEFDKTKDQMLKRGLLDIYDISDKKNEWVVLEEYIFWSQRLQTEIIIPRWIKTDLASVPKGLRWLISVNERHRIPALVHDFGYAIAQQTSVSRNDWDKVLRDFCKVYEVPMWKTNAIYTAVKLGGKIAFEADSELFIPTDHRQWYKNEFDKVIDLDITDGRYKVI